MARYYKGARCELVLTHRQIRPGLGHPQRGAIMLFNYYPATTAGMKQAKKTASVLANQPRSRVTVSKRCEGGVSKVLYECEKGFRLPSQRKRCRRRGSGGE